ncbi:transposase [Bacillus sp. Leaf13]|nr:transposase [Bacillus sp. Leaf13]
MTKRERRTFTSEFKKQMIQLYQSGKTRKALIEEYELTPSSLDRWIQQSENTGSFKEKDNRSLEEKELIKLRKELKQLQMENDILKQAALILGRK